MKLFSGLRVTIRTELEEQIRKKTDFETFFNLAPKINPNASLIKGVVCGVRVEEKEPTP